MPNYQKISKNISEIIFDNPRTENHALHWINITNAGKSEIEYLRKKFNLDLYHLHASSAKVISQRPIISHGADYMFMILHFPIFENGQIIAGEIDFFISHGYLITSHNDNIKALNEFFNLCKKDGDSSLAFKFESSAMLLYEILEKLMLYSFNIIDQNSIELTRLEELIFAQDSKKAVSNILALRRNIINFRKIMQNHKDILKKLMQMESAYVSPDILRNYYTQLIDYSKTIWSILDSHKEMIEVLNSTNESLLNYRISDIMKTLTIFSVIVFPLTLLAAIFGMNTMNGMPFVSSPHGFWIIIAIMLTGSLFMLLFFERKKWL